MSYHEPVLLKESIAGLALKPEGIYVDVTLGGGGHSREILKHLSTGRLIAFDQDRDSGEATKDLQERSFTWIEANFRYLKKYLRSLGIPKINGLLADLGVSSHQFDTPERGFSTRFDAELDMRMDTSATLTAKDIVQSYSESDLHKILGMYGELTNARSVAQAIVKARANQKINTVFELKEAVKGFAPRGRENKFYAQLFQALRIEVNDELKALQELLEQCAEVMAPEGRLVVISYHSLEDRLVKNFINQGKFYGEAEKDLYGHIHTPFKPLTRKPVEATEEETERNSRARSAKLRVAEKK